MAQYSIGGRGPAILGVQLTLLAFAIITFAMRLYVHVKLVKKSSAIWVAGFGLIIYTAYSGMCVVAVLHGQGQEARFVSQANIFYMFKLYFTFTILYILANVAVKLAISWMLLGIVVEKAHKTIIYLVTALMQIISLVYMLVLLFQCRPIEFFWMRLAGSVHGECMDIRTIVILTYVYAIGTIVFDLVMVVLPWFVVRNMQQSFRTKIMVAFLLGLGSIPCLVTIVRVAYIDEIFYSKDPLHDLATFSILSVLETGIIIIASNATTFRPLFKKMASNANISPQRYEPRKLPPSLGGLSSGPSSLTATSPTAYSPEIQKQSIELSVRHKDTFARRRSLVSV